MQLKNLKYKVLIFLLSLFITTSITWADGYKDVYPELPVAMNYTFEFWEKSIKTTTDFPETVAALIMKYYDIPTSLKKKLYLRGSLVFDNQYLIRISIQDAKNSAKFPLEAKTRNAIATKTCEVVSKQFEAYCVTLSDILESRPQVIVNLNDQKVIPVPTAVKPSPVVNPSINIENFDWVTKKNFTSFDNRYIGLGVGNITPDFFKDLKYPLNGETVSHHCFAGSHGIADVNGDGVNDLLLLGGGIDDQLFYWQVVDKIYAYGRIYINAIDISQGIAKPIFQEELFAYEMDYKGQSEGIGDGIVREARIFWGDFNNDGKYDYLVRRKQADISTNFGGLTRSWTTQNVVEKAVLYEGSTDGYRKSQYNDEKFLKYIQENTNWDEGFLQPNNCK